MIRVEDDRDTIRRSNTPNVVGSSNSTRNRSLLVLVVYTLPAEESRASLRHLQDDGSLHITRGLEGCYDSGG